MHCSGGLHARERLLPKCWNQRSSPKPLLIELLTVLTSMGSEDLAGIGLDIEPQVQVLRLAAWRRKPASTA